MLNCGVGGALCVDFPSFRVLEIEEFSESVESLTDFFDSLRVTLKV